MTWRPPCTDTPHLSSSDSNTRDSESTIMVDLESTPGETTRGHLFAKSPVFLHRPHVDGDSPRGTRTRHATGDLVTPSRQSTKNS